MRVFHGQQVRVGHVLQAGPAVQVLVGLDVRVLVGGAHVVGVVRLGKEPRRAQHHHRQPAVPRDDLAQVLGRGLGHPVDVARHRGH
ncbi:MAG TPA: hypothetical protein VG268_16705, partial [Streptosporangiaceae bacterium]|nr:hypothetical protein [Streptosporangiaceae bacterium]